MPQPPRNRRRHPACSMRVTATPAPVERQLLLPQLLHLNSGWLLLKLQTSRGGGP